MKPLSVSRKLCTLVLASLLSFSFTACAGSDTADSQSSGQAASGVIPTDNSFHTNAQASPQGSQSAVEESAPSENTSAPNSSFPHTASNPNSSKIFDSNEGSVDKSLLGTWQYTQNTGITYAFNADHEMIFGGFGSSQTFLYYTKDGCIYFAANENTHPAKVKYTIEGNILHMNDSLGATLDYQKIN